MHPLLIAGIIGAAFILGRKAGEKKKQLPPPPSIPLPTPDAPLPLPEGTTGDYSEAWAGVTYGVEIYPPGAPTNFPPPPADGLVAAPGCSVIAVSDGWWDVLGDYVETLIAEDGESPESLFSQIVAKFLPNCAGKDTQAYGLIKAELMDRLEGLFPQADLQEKPPLDIQVPLGEGSQVLVHPKPGVGDHVIVMEPKNVYNPAIGQHVPSVYWRAWQPGPVTTGSHFREGFAPTYDEAADEARAAIDEYATVSAQANRGRRNPGGRFTTRSTSRAGLGLFRWLPKRRRRKFARRF